MNERQRRAIEREVKQAEDYLSNLRRALAAEHQEIARLEEEILIAGREVTTLREGL